MINTSLFAPYQAALEELFGELDYFAELDWGALGLEYLASLPKAPSDEGEFLAGFPDFLQKKAEQDECPNYFFELAWFLLAEAQLLNSTFEPPLQSGFHLNPTLCFLSFEFNIMEMLELARTGKAEIIPGPMLVCLYHHPENGPSAQEMPEEWPELLTPLENGPIRNLNPYSSEQKEQLKILIELGLVLEVKA